MNKSLLWDYDWKPEEYATERFIRWYIARVLSRGTDADVKEIDPRLIAKYLEILAIPRRIREFWEWWLKEKGYLGEHSHSLSTPVS